jgi:hypothetical protein
MLECDGVLRTWSLEELPRWWQVFANRKYGILDISFAAWNFVRAYPLGDHRIAYLDYEGPVSGDRGYVRRLDAGKVEFLRNKVNDLEAVLKGEVLRNSTVHLEQMDDGWQLNVS